MAISRSDLNPPHSDIYVRERSVQNNLSFRTPGELASPYPSTGLRESAAPPDVGIFFLRSGELFLLLAPFWRPLVPLGALLGVLWRLMRRSWALLARFRSLL